MNLDALPDEEKQAMFQEASQIEQSPMKLFKTQQEAEKFKEMFNEMCVSVTRIESDKEGYCLTTDSKTYITERLYQAVYDDALAFWRGRIEANSENT